MDNLYKPIYATRTKCIECNNKHLSTIFSIESFPIYMGCVDHPLSKDLYAPFAVDKCLNCGQIQLKHLIAADILYKYSHNPAIGTTWAKHNNMFVDYISKHKDLNNIDIVDFGGGNGKIAQIILSRYKVKSYTIIDWNYESYPKVDNVIYLSEIPNKKYDLFISSHTLEHLYNPREDLSNLLFPLVKEGGGFAFSIPNIEEQLKNNFTNALNFEHTYVPRVNGVNKYVDSNYIMAYYENGPDEDALPEHMLTGNHSSDIFLTQDVYLFGGHIFSQRLYHAISSGTKYRIKGIIDNDPAKQGKRLYGTPYTVLSTEQADKQYPVIVNCAQYTDEIKEDLIKKGFKIYEIPRFDVLGPTPQRY